MFCLLITFLIYAIHLTDIEEFQNNDESIYSVISASLLLSVATNGLIGFGLVFLKKTYLPMELVYVLIFVFMMINNILRKDFFFFINKFKNEFNNILNIYRKGLFIKLILIFLFLMLLVSIGPVNHSDAANAYVGYPYKFWLKNSHFIDGNLNQGLLGIGDFANIFYFKDKTTWLIRTTQFLPIVPIVFLILKRGTNKLILLVILSSPVFIQWLSIGKTNFLSESSIAIIFLIWERFRQKRDLILLLNVSLISISFKISAILVCIPIFIYLVIVHKKNITNFNLSLLKKYLLYWPTLVSFLSLITILCYRNYLHDNPFYPLLSSFFNPDNHQLIDWENLLKDWDRSGFFQLWVFFPEGIRKISFVLGPSNFVIFISTIFLILRKNKSDISINSIIGIAQFIMLLLFAQGRADYYISPLLLTYVGIEKFDFYSKFNIFKKILNFSIIIQSLMFLISSLYIIYTTAIIFIDYESGMNKIAWNYYNSKIVAQKAISPVYNESMGMTHLYYDDDFISNHRFLACSIYDQKVTTENVYYLCAKNLGIKTIIVDENKLKNNKKFNCQTEELIRVSRNIFLTQKKKVDFCYLN